MTSSIDLDRLEALAKAATQGPWEVHQDAATGCHEVRTEYDGDVDGDTGRHIIVGGDLIALMADSQDEEDNAAFIAALNPQTVLDLISASRGSGVPEGWRPIETAPTRKEGDPLISVLVSWTNADGTQGVGEAEWHPDESEAGGDWWWANTGPGDYHADPIRERITGQITHWQPLPAAPTPSGGGGAGRWVSR